jgi:hypothetical protein
MKIIPSSSRKLLQKENKTSRNFEFVLFQGGIESNGIKILITHSLFGRFAFTKATIPLR